MARSLWTYPRRAGPEAEEKQEDDQGGQADRKTDRGGGWGKGELRGGDVPTMYPAVIRRGVPFALASKTGGRGGVSFFFLTNNCVSRLCSGREDWGDSVRVGAPIRRSHTPRCEKAGRCTFLVKPPGFFFPKWSRCTYMVKPLACIGERYARW